MDTVDNTTANSVPSSAFARPHKTPRHGSTADANPPAPAPAPDSNHRQTHLTDRGVDALPSVAPFAAASAFIPTRVVSPETSVLPYTPTGAVSPHVNPTQSSPGVSASPSSPTTRKHKPSLLLRLRGEAKVISGRIRRDPVRVEEGRRMLDGET
ncbi:hypothetical protein C8R43DRAFT_1037659 [Mycena crocata]|nr:hypothetical protein C8R43DRAFT_1037659 [Mycena crocata]